MACNAKDSHARYWDLQLERGRAREEEIRDFCEGKIAYFKIPEYVRFVDAFPMTVSGKVQKFVIREQEICERGHEEVARIRTAYARNTTEFFGALRLDAVLPF